MARRTLFIQFYLHLNVTADDMSIYTTATQNTAAGTVEGAWMEEWEWQGLLEGGVGRG